MFRNHNHKKVKINHSTLNNKIVPRHKPVFTPFRKNVIIASTVAPVIIPSTGIFTDSTISKEPTMIQPTTLQPVQQTISIPVEKIIDDTTINTNTTISTPVDTTVEKKLVDIPTTMNSSFTVKNKKEKKYILKNIYRLLLVV